MQINSKLPDIGLSIFSMMTQLANAHGAYNLSQGFPDFDVDPDLIRIIEKNMRMGHNQYAPMQGVMTLREQIAGKVSELYHANYSPETEITVTAGATEALFAAITATVKKDDEVIVFEPAFDSYVPAIQLNGGIPVYLKLKFPGYQYDWDAVKDAITDKTRLMILNSPHNPTGTVLSDHDISALTQIIQNTKLLIISDEVYEHIIFDGLRHESISRYPELSERSFVIGSFGKTYHSTGWKVGYCLAPEPLSIELQKSHQFITFSVNTPIQYAYAEFLENKDVYLNLPDFYQSKRDKFIHYLKDSPLKPLPCKGTYFLMVDYSAISNEKDTVFAERLTVENGVASIPPSAFYHQGEDNKVLRFCFAKKDETMKRAAEKLCKI